MSNLATIRALIVTARNNRNSKKSRIEALNEAETIRKGAKLSWKKVEADFDLASELKSIEDFKVKDRAPAEKKQGVCHYIRQQLVESTKDYTTILNEVLATWPEAKTSHKSIASLARDLRKEGVEVASRRPSKKVAEETVTETAEQQVEENEAVEEQAAA